MINGIPDRVVAFNVYESGNKLVGVTGEVTLPDIEIQKGTLNVAGMTGEVEVPTLGRTSAMEIEIPFQVLYGDIYKLFTQNEIHELTLRASIQLPDSSTSLLSTSGIKVFLKGIPNKLTTGKFSGNSTMDSSVTFSILYYLLEVDGKKQIEIDPLNSICYVNGKDMLEEVRKQI